MIGDVLSGKEFNKKYNGTVFVKLIKKSKNHNGYHYKTGKNKLGKKETFNPTSSCSPGGLYFTKLSKLTKWLDYDDYEPMYYCSIVTIPKNARVYIEKDKFKTDKFILGKFKLIKKLKYWSSHKFCERAATNY